MIVDIAVGAVLLISSVISFLRGFIREVLTILGVVGGLAAAYFGGPQMSLVTRGWLGVKDGIEPERLLGFIPYTILADVLAYGGIFAVVVIVLSLISHILAESVKSMGLGAIDRTLGVLFGLARGVILLGLLYLPIHILVEDGAKDEWFAGSKTHFYLEATADQMAHLLPESTIKKIEDETKNIEETVTTREKLQKLNVLRKDEQQPAEPEEEGYNEEFRDKMDELFKMEKPDNGNE